MKMIDRHPAQALVCDLLIDGGGSDERNIEGLAYGKRLWLPHAR